MAQPENGQGHGRDLQYADSRRHLCQAGMPGGVPPDVVRWAEGKGSHQGNHARPGPLHNPFQVVAVVDL
ncbi:hypothetical protein GCM10010435_40910 [Winogradskya consettensis]|uniref:Uncharacterized protein n=1 Tax=Winogradskya consettensis TaxID=113560 RepID=A0A919SEW5_9ACTN|nr:hypothetical protein Aco04nite_17040 [Actinoplanes consettensis]